LASAGEGARPFEDETEVEGKLDVLRRAGDRGRFGD